MILTEQQIELITKKGLYDCLLSKRNLFSNVVSDPHPLGNIIIFESPLVVGRMHFENSLNICAELPNANIFGGVCFQRLFSAQLGSIISEITKLSCHVEENSIFVEGKQASIAIVNQIKSNTIFHILFPIFVSEELKQSLYGLNINEELLNEIKTHSIQCFHHLTRSLFLETQRDNI